MARIPLLLLALLALVTFASAAAPTFCKCTCFKNSTIIPLGPEHQNDDSDDFLARRGFPFSPELANPHLPVMKDPRTASASCSECTKAFCLGQGIDFCKDAEEDDVVTMCFKRDSNKDKIIVWGFIFGTVGLLGYAVFRRVMEWRADRGFSRQNVNYAPMGDR